MIPRCDHGVLFNLDCPICDSPFDSEVSSDGLTINLTIRDESKKGDSNE